ncbi:MAG: transposase [Acetilactobacillus jinshanensis]
MNVSNFLMDDHGNEVPNPKFYTHGLPHLKYLNQRVNRRRRYATNHHIDLSVDRGYQRARIRHARFEVHITNERRNFLDNLSTKLIENQDLIVAENLKSSNILRNHKIAQKASDCGWREFLSMLQYKAKLYGKTVILVNPAYTTQKCSKCGFVCTKNNGYPKKHGKHLDLDDRYWWCPNCGTYHIRDLNAAINILRSQSTGELKSTSKLNNMV